MSVKQKTYFGFERSELLGVGFILLIVVALSWQNFAIAERRGRDAQRKNDMFTIQNGLNDFIKELGFTPASSPDGKIVACGEVESLRPCEWGEDALQDVSDLNYPPYVARLPIDPQSRSGVEYKYFSLGGQYQILGSLEGEDEDEYREDIRERGVECGTRVCNFGKSSHDGVPLDKSLQEYQNELKGT